VDKSALEGLPDRERRRQEVRLFEYIYMELFDVTRFFFALLG
jgi:hypothetical protein